MTTPSPPGRTPLDKLIDPWLQVAAAADAFFGRAVAAHRDQLACGPGCHRCCAPALTVMLVEALALLDGIERLAPARRAALITSAPSATARCALLEPDGRCAVYDRRPLICRTHGLPVRQREEVGCCELNFRHGAPPSAVLDGERLTAALAVADGMVRAKLSLDGTELSLDGTELSLDGTELSLDGTELSLDGTELSLDGTGAATIAPCRVEIAALLARGVAALPAAARRWLAGSAG